MRAAPRRRSHDDASGERRRRERGTLARCVCSRYADFPLTPGDSAPQRYDSPLPSVVSSRNRTANQFQSLYSRQGWLVMFDDFWQNRASAKVTLDQREKKNIYSIYICLDAVSSRSLIWYTDALESPSSVINTGNSTRKMIVSWLMFGRDCIEDMILIQRK